MPCPGRDIADRESRSAGKDVLVDLKGRGLDRRDLPRPGATSPHG
jgi:hypothetical protein